MAAACAVLCSAAAFGQTVVPFNGMIDLQQARAQLNVGCSASGCKFTFDGAMTGRGVYHLKMDISHVRFPLMDVAAVIEGDVKLTGDTPDAREFAGEFRSSYLLLNYAPFRDASVKFAVRDRKLVIDPFWMGGVSGRGEIGLTGRREMNLNIEVVAADIEEVAALIRAMRGASGAAPFEFTGVMKGALGLTGVWPRPYVQGRLSAYNGCVKKFDYDTISIDFDGQYPLLNVKEALVTQAEGVSFRLSGPFDLGDWAGLTAQVRRMKKVPVTLANDNRREWVIRRQQTSDEMHTEMKYLFLKDDRGDTEGILGIQKSIGF